jgi:quercetin dioxygenase-like cupin family protein
MIGNVRWRPLTGFLIAVLTMGPALSSPVHAETAQVTVQPMTSFRLPDLPGKSVSLVRVSFPPNAVSSQHRHAGTVTAFVLSGSIRSQITGEPARVYKAGESSFEPPGVVHLVAENASSTEPAELLAIFIADAGAILTTNAQ